MAKSKNEKKYYEELRNHIDENLTTEELGRLVKEYGKIFAMNVIILRYLPWVSTGLKPVETRAIYSLFKSKAYIDASKHYIKTLKLDRAKGNLASIHPHSCDGMKPVIKLSQKWNTGAPLVTINGNYGNPQGDEAAAERYLSIALSYYGYMCFFKDFDEKIVDMKATFNDDDIEPEFTLPCRYPHALTIGLKSIMPGLSTGLYPCNFAEACRYTIDVLKGKNPKFLYPDFPSGCDVIDNGEFKKNINKKDQWKFVVRAKSEIDEKTNTVRLLATTPTNTFINIMGNIQNLIDEKVIKPLSGNGYEDNTDRDTKELDININLRKEVDPYKFLQIMYKKGGFQETIPMNMNMVDNYKFATYTQREIVDTFISNRRDYLRRLSIRQYRAKSERVIILDILLLILSGNNIEKTIKIIRSGNKADAIEKLCKEFNINSVQAAEIVAMPLGRFSKDSIAGFKEELALINKELPELDLTIRDIKRVDKIIIEQLEEGIKLFGTPRRSRIIKKTDDKMFSDGKFTMVITNDGMVKKLPENTQDVGALKEGDKVSIKVEAGNGDKIFVVDEKGMTGILTISDISLTSKKAQGDHVTKLLPSIKNKIVSVKVIPYVLEEKANDGEDITVGFITKSGICKKSKLLDYYISRKADGIKLAPRDKVVDVKVFTPGMEMIMYDDKGYGIRVNVEDIKTSGKLTKGSTIMKTTGSVLGCKVFPTKDSKDGILIMTNKGKAKIVDNNKMPQCKLEEHYRLATLASGEQIADIMPVDTKGTVTVVLTGSEVPLSLRDMMPFTPRLAACKKVVAVKRGDVVLGLK